MRIFFYYVGFFIMNMYICFIYAKQYSNWFSLRKSVSQYIIPKNIVYNWFYENGSQAFQSRNILFCQFSNSSPPAASLSDTQDTHSLSGYRSS